MGYRIEGEINIPLEEFWEFVSKYAPQGIGNVMYGVPYIDPDNIHDLTINFVESTYCDPSNEMEPCSVALEWEQLIK
jgi:hypothetical protein